jgi:hypothetical protein
VALEGGTTAVLPRATTGCAEAGFAGAAAEDRAGVDTPGDPVFADDTLGHDLHAKTTPTPQATPTRALAICHRMRRFFPPASGANSSNVRTFPSHMLNSILRGGAGGGGDGDGDGALPGDTDRI